MIKYYCDACGEECKSDKSQLALGRIANRTDMYKWADFCDKSIRIDHICKSCEGILFKMVKGFLKGCNK